MFFILARCRKKNYILNETKSNKFYQFKQIFTWEEVKRMKKYNWKEKTWKYRSRQNHHRHYQVSWLIYNIKRNIVMKYLVANYYLSFCTFIRIFIENLFWVISIIPNLFVDSLYNFFNHIQIIFVKEIKSLF